MASKLMIMLLGLGVAFVAVSNLQIQEQYTVPPNLKAAITPRFGTDLNFGAKIQWKKPDPKVMAFDPNSYNVVSENYQPVNHSDDVIEHFDDFEDPNLPYNECSQSDDQALDTINVRAYTTFKLTDRTQKVGDFIRGDPPIVPDTQVRLTRQQYRPQESLRVGALNVIMGSETQDDTRAFVEARTGKLNASRFM